MNIITASNARSDLFNLVKKTAKGHVPVTISSKEGNVVMISQDDYESLVETAELLSIDGFVKSIKKADKEIKKGQIVDFESIFEAN